MRITNALWFQPRMDQNVYQGRLKQYFQKKEALSRQFIPKQTIPKQSTFNEPVSCLDGLRLYVKDSISANQSMAIKSSTQTAEEEGDNKIFTVDRTYKVSIYKPGQEAEIVELKENPLAAATFEVRFQQKTVIPMKVTFFSSQSGLTDLKYEVREVNCVKYDLGSFDPDKIFLKSPSGRISSHLTLYVPEGGKIEVDDGEGNFYTYDDAKRTNIDMVV